MSDNIKISSIKKCMGCDEENLINYLDDFKRHVLNVKRSGV